MATLSREVSVEFFPIFLTVVFVVRNQALSIEHVLRTASARLTALVGDHELLIVDNASDDDSVATLQRLTAESGLPNLQVYALTKEVDSDTAAWVGLENALGDFVAVVEPSRDDLAFLPAMLDRALAGADVVFARNTRVEPQGMLYRFANAVFNSLYLNFNGIDLARDAPQYRVLGKRVVNFMLQHRQPALTYRHLPASGGFLRANLEYATQMPPPPRKRLGDGIDRGMRLLVSTTRAPMRVVTSLSLFGACANVVYSIYVVAVGLLKQDVAPGWVSLSLQQSGMFLLISLVLLVLGEYILHMASLSNEGPQYYVGQEFTSTRITRREKLNVEDVVQLGRSSPG